MRRTTKGTAGSRISYIQTRINNQILYLQVVLNNAAIGIVTSFFLSQLNSILKTFASALELLFTAVLCYLIFGIPIYLNTIISIFVVSLAIWVYSRNPVDNRKALQPVTEVHNEDLQKLVGVV
jgi:predicted membrane protein